MSTARDTAGETFNNTYHNSTLVGNWLEDRLQRGTRDGHRSTTQDDGLLADPRITRARNAPRVRKGLMHSTYSVDYDRNSVTDGRPVSAQAGAEGEGGSSASTREQQQVLLAFTATWLESTHGKTGVDRALLFSEDPVADPTAELPVSTNTDTYGAFYRDGTNTAADGGVTGASAQNTRRSGSRTARGDTACDGQSDERNLYESVMNAKARLATPTTNTSSTTPDQRSKAATRATAVGSSLSMRSATVVGFTALAAPAPGNNTSATAEEEDGIDARWCTTKQAADIPVEHCVFQRRLPPARV
jgi:hypothetical protein